MYVLIYQENYGSRYMATNIQKILKPFLCCDMLLTFRQNVFLLILNTITFYITSKMQ